MRGVSVLLLVIAALAVVTDSFDSHFSDRLKHTCVRRHNKRARNLPLLASAGDDDGDKIINVYADSRDVDAVIAEVMKLVNRRANLNNGENIEITKTALVESDEKIGNSLNVIESSFKTIFSNLKGSETLSSSDKNTLFTELSLLYSDLKESPDNVVSYKDFSTKKLQETIPKTSIYAESAAPYCVVFGPGPVGTALVATLRSLGQAAEVRYIDGNALSSMQDSELKYAVRGGKTVILACDDAGSKDGITPFKSVVNEKGLKRLLNAVMVEKNNRQDSAKVVTLGRATKEPKSLMSFMSGDTTEFESEVILQCGQRGIGYGVVKVANIIADADSYPTGAKTRSIKYSLSALKSEDEARTTSQVPDSPMVVTRSRVEFTEVTRTSVAVNALLRLAVYPNANSTVSVLSTDCTRAPTDAEWDDELLKIVGPELGRVPLRFAGVAQTALRLGRIALDLQKPGSGLVTPIEVERFSNGARILFRPKESSYLSSKDEKSAAAAAAADSTSAVASPKTIKSGYISPEEEKRLARLAEGAAVAAPPVKAKPPKLEGGLEIIVDERPYRRVRIRRCNMGPQTIVKEESEALVLKRVLQGIQALDNDFRVLLGGGSK